MHGYPFASTILQMSLTEEERTTYYREQIEQGRVDAPMSLRIFAGVADGLLAWLLSILIFSLSILILTNGNMSKRMGSLLKDMEEESSLSGLVIYGDDGVAETESTRVDRYLKSILSYDGSEAPSDELYHYYCVYTNVEKEVTPVSKFNTDILYVNQADSYFEVVGEYAVLKDELKTHLAAYYTVDRLAEDINAYQSLAEFYKQAHNEAWKGFISTEPYVSWLNSYMELATSYYLAIGGMHIFAYLAAGMICYYLIPTIKKRGTTLGKKVLHIEPKMINGNDVTWPAIFMRGSIEILLGCWAIPLSGFFVYGFDSMTVPFIVIGNFVAQLSIFLIAGLVLSIASLAFAVARKDNRAISDFAAGTWVVTTDVTRIRNAQAELREIERQRGQQDE